MNYQRGPVFMKSVCQDPQPLIHPQGALCFLLFEKCYSPQAACDQSPPTDSTTPAPMYLLLNFHVLKHVKKVCQTICFGVMIQARVTVGYEYGLATGRTPLRSIR